jgi:DNA helicase-2/ATP-dependent DNA helicase PcrA
MDPILDPLNDAQREAVLHGDGPLLVLAGAGSGKTRVIVHRVAHLVRHRGVAPWHVLCVTFTNKAAGEMKERLAELLGPEGEQAWVSTFHAFGARFLRREAQAAGLSQSFPIYDDGDQMSLAKRLIAEARIDGLTPREALSRIDRWKNDGLRPSLVKLGSYDPRGEAALAIWKGYERALQRAGAVDFNDLLLRPLQLLEKDPQLLARWSSRFRYVLVDEFQDTNPAQYRLVKHLCGARRNVCVVGDDDQAIYRWRGADVSNILDFDKDYPGTRVVKLEQNYRSSRFILDAAHAVIEKAARRRAKKLWTEREGGAPLALLVSDDEHQEGERIARAATAAHAAGAPWEEIAVLYRVNAQSRSIESAMRAARIPYVIVRGQSFYERAEVKDAAAYLRLALEPRSDLDLLRVVNRPSRKIGEKTVERLQEVAQARGASLFELLSDLSAVPGLKPAAARALAGFRDLVAGLHARLADLSAAEAVKAVLEGAELIERLRLEGTDEAVERAENLLELLAAAREFDEAQAGQAPPEPPPGEEADPVPPPLARFLEQIALLGEADAPTPEGRVALMTLHAAKGLEFDAVFLAGMEEGTLPHERPWKDETPSEKAASLDEERRLCYVGMTRARHQLTLSLARRRMSYGENGPSFRSTEPSRFLGDLPPALFGLAGRAAAPPPVAPAPRGPVIRRHPGALATEPHIELEAEPLEERTPGERSIDYAFDQTEGGGAFARGSRVRHQGFGEGLVLSTDGPGGDAKVTVSFFTVGEKRVLARFLRPA